MSPVTTGDQPNKKGLDEEKPNKQPNKSSKNVSGGGDDNGDKRRKDDDNNNNTDTKTSSFEEENNLLKEQLRQLRREKQEIINAFNVEKQVMEGKLATIQVQMLEAEEYHKQQKTEMMKIIEKKNYESHYPIPEKLARVFAEHPDCFAIQILGKLFVWRLK